MNARPAKALLIFLLALGASLSARSVTAQRVPSRALREVREKLTDYEPAAALEAVADLTALLAGRGRLGPDDRDEARFLRALTAADLFLLSGRPGWPSIDDRVASALGVSRSRARAHVRDELRALEKGRFEGLARDARAALEAASGEREEERSGPRLDLTRLVRVVAALERDDPVDALARLVRDPCDPGPCEGTLADLSPRSRRALRAFREGLGAAARLDVAIEFGDPFSRALEPEIHRLSVKIAHARLRLGPRAEPGVGALLSGGDADVFVTITEEALVVQGAPVFALDEGAVRSVSPGRCAARTKVQLPDPGPPTEPVRELVRALPRGCGDRVAVAAEDGVAAREVLRAVASVRAAELRYVGLAGVGPLGELVVRPLGLSATRGRARVDVAGHDLVVRRGRAREHVPLEGLDEAGGPTLARLAEIIGAAEVASLRVSPDVPFTALRVILRALDGDLERPSP